MTILKKVPEGAQVLDLGAARVARAEARAAEGKGSIFLKLAVGFVEVKPEFAVTVAFDFKDERIKEGLEGVLVDPADVDALFADGLTGQDMEAISQFIAGKPLGESLASPKP